MYIVVLGNNEETVFIEERKEAYTAAKEMARQTGKDVRVYKAALTAIASQTVAITKIKKARVQKEPEVDVAKIAQKILKKNPPKPPKPEPVVEPAKE